MTTDPSGDDWLENLTSFGPDTKITSGAAAAAEGRALLEAALGGPEAVERANRGRQPLDGSRRRGYRSPTRSFRLTEDLDARLTALIESQHRTQSDVMREALTEYFARHAG
jgi:hypothetical protein